MDVSNRKAVDVSSECRRVSLTSTLVLGRTTNSFVFHALRPWPPSVMIAKKSKQAERKITVLRGGDDGEDDNGEP